MTLVVVILIGAGVILIGSALDNTPILQTVQKIMSNQPVNWTGQSGSKASSGSSASSGDITQPTF